jgi:hypothetical protein
VLLLFCFGSPGWLATCCHGGMTCACQVVRGSMRQFLQLPLQVCPVDRWAWC